MMSVCRPDRCANAASVRVDWLQQLMSSVCRREKCAKALSVIVD